MSKAEEILEALNNTVASLQEADANVAYADEAVTQLMELAEATGVETSIQSAGAIAEALDEFKLMLAQTQNKITEVSGAVHNFTQGG